tara:strand:+ start:203 stop:442 length:240 start_codon:yes stop_codon:yes gene_type:complete
MPSKEQKKRDKREQNEEKRLLEQQLFREDYEWEKGTNKRSIIKRQEKADKLFEKIRRKQERDAIYDEENNNKILDYDSD